MLSATTADGNIPVIGGSSRQNQPVLLEKAGHDDELQMPLASGVEHMELDAGTRRVYYTKSAQRALFVRDLAGGEEKLVTTSIESTLIDGWRVVDGRIWYVAKIAWKPTDLIEFDPATGTQRPLGHLAETELHDVGFSAAPNREHVVLTPLGTEDTNINSFHLNAAAR